MNNFELAYIFQHNVSKEYLCGSVSYPVHSPHPLAARTFWSQRQLSQFASRYDSQNELRGYTRDIIDHGGITRQHIESIERYDIACIDKDLRVVCTIPITQIRQKLVKLPRSVKDAENYTNK